MSKKVIYTGTTLSTTFQEICIYINTACHIQNMQMSKYIYEKQDIYLFKSSTLVSSKPWKTYDNEQKWWHNIPRKIVENDFVGDSVMWWLQP